MTNTVALVKGDLYRTHYLLYGWSMDGKTISINANTIVCLLKGPSNFNNLVHVYVFYDCCKGRSFRKVVSPMDIPKFYSKVL
jgi:hypothetical protein